mmetsp:Transcript_3879/g.14430  ORF Transcript_3879/g.14430 Transcript_3879/m.14430 type:complete len:228 (-) Transcript_3879:571-1254(-)
MPVEPLEFVLQIHDRLQIQDALHHVCQRHGERHSAIPGRAQYPLRIRVRQLRGQAILLLSRSVPHLLQIRHHRHDRLPEHGLDLLLHELSEVLEANGVHVLAAEPLRLHLIEVGVVHVLSQVLEGLRGINPLLPEGQGQREGFQALWQISVAHDPLVHILGCQIPVILVELVADQDGALKLGVNTPALLKRGHRRCVSSLLDAEHDVALVPHEGHVELLDLCGEILF